MDGGREAGARAPGAPDVAIATAGPAALTSSVSFQSPVAVDDGLSAVDVGNVASADLLGGLDVDLDAGLDHRLD